MNPETETIKLKEPAGKNPRPFRGRRCNGHCQEQTLLTASVRRSKRQGPSKNDSQAEEGKVVRGSTQYKKCGEMSLSAMGYR